MDKYIADKLSSFRNLLDESLKASPIRGGRNKSPRARMQIKAYTELGMALHPVMDSTSPEHKRWQLFTWDQETIFKHGNMPNTQEDLGVATSGNYTEETMGAMDNAANGLNLH